jgi:hypothetical protein
MVRLIKVFSKRGRFCYPVDSETALVWNTDGANFSASGLKRQDNDLVVIENAEAAAAFKHAFDARFFSGEALLISVRLPDREIGSTDFNDGLAMTNEGAEGVLGAEQLKVALAPICAKKVSEVS